MAGSLKKVSIIGNLGSDPTMRYMQDGTPVASFNVAVNERPRRGQGSENAPTAQAAQAEEITTWFRVSAWRRQAEIVNDLLKKGMSVFVSGDLRTSEFTGNDGNKRFSLDVTMQDMQILTPKGMSEGGSFEESHSGSSGSQGRTPIAFGGPKTAPRSEPSADEDEGDIPF
jgi:single-strand DNA-binding protein